MGVAKFMRPKHVFGVAGSVTSGRFTERQKISRRTAIWNNVSFGPKARRHKRPKQKTNISRSIPVKRRGVPPPPVHLAVPVGFSADYDSPDAGLANAVTSTFTISTAGAVGFGVDDSIHTDNRGGVSLLISLETPVPELSIGECSDLYCYRAHNEIPISTRASSMCANSA